MVEPTENIEKETNETVNPNKKPPVIVVYCPKCGLPPEYCEFDEKCKLPANPNPNPHPEEKNNKKQAVQEEKKTENIEKEPKEEKDQAKPKKKPALKAEDKIVISKQTRSKKKFLTSVTGLEKFNVNIKEFAKKMGKKFACGSSAISDDTIEIQGDIMDELKEFILKEFSQLNEKQIVIKEKKTEK